MGYDWTESETRGQASNDTCSLQHCKAREKESSIQNQIMKIQQVQIIRKVSHRFSLATKSLNIRKLKQENTKLISALL